MFKQRLFNTKLIASVEIKKIIHTHLIEMITAGFLFLLLVRRGSSWTAFTNNALMFLSVVVGIVGFGILSSWVFSREFTEGTFKDLLALPISRTTIISGKLLAIEIAELMAVLLSVMFILITGTVILGHAPSLTTVHLLLNRTWVTFVYDMLLSFLWPLIATLSRSSMLPMSLSFLALIIDVMFASQSVGKFIPWAIPGFCLANPEANMTISKLIVVIIADIGIFGTIYVWNRTDQK